MKKLFAAALFALLGTGAFAQTAPGTVVMSGDVGFSTSSTEGDNYDNSPKTTSFRIGPSLGYFLNEGLELGLNLRYNHYKNSYDRVGNDYSVDYVNNGFRFSPYLKKYFLVSDKVAFTGSAFVGYAFSKSKTESDNAFMSDVEMKDNTFDVGVAPGIVFFPTEKIGISGSLGNLGYRTTKTKGEAFERTISNFNFDLSSGLYLGFSYYISR